MTGPNFHHHGIGNQINIVPQGQQPQQPQQQPAQPAPRPAGFDRFVGMGSATLEGVGYAALGAAAGYFGGQFLGWFPDRAGIYWLGDAFRYAVPAVSAAAGFYLGFRKSPDYTEGFSDWRRRMF